MLQLLNRELHLPEKYIRYITKLSDQAPRLESYLVRHGIVRDIHDFQRVNGKLVIC
jgi:hypothetical protein